NADAQGIARFTVSLAGSYGISATKEGYVTPQGGPSSVRVDSGQPRGEFVVRLARPGEITGRLIDDATGEPIVSQVVSLGTFRYSSGHRVIFMAWEVLTNSDGRFVKDGLSPGAYLVSTSLPETKIQPYLEGSLDRVDEGYERVFLPSGDNPDSAIPIALPPT